jgi:hypothetical protein
MNLMLKVILAVYNFFVGDLVILLGVTLLMVILALIDSLTALAPLRGASGAILIASVLVTLVVTLGREVIRAENKEQG